MRLGDPSLRFPPNKAAPNAGRSYHVLSAALSHLVPEIVALALDIESGHPKCPAETMELFVRGFTLITSHCEIPTWLVILCQAYLDIYAMVDGMPEIGVRNLIDHCGRASRVLDNQKAFLVTSGDKKEAEERSLTFDMLYGGLTESLKSLARHFDMSMTAVQQQDDGYFEASRQLRRLQEVVIALPVYSANKIYLSKLELLQYGTSHADLGYFILTAAHFYRACRHYGLIAKPWHDMELIVAQQSHKQAFVTTPHTKADHKAILRHYQMAMGAPASNYARDRKLRGSNSDKLAKTGRKIQIISPFSNKMTARVSERSRLHGSDYFDQHGDVITAVLESLTEKPTSTSTAQSKKHGFQSSGSHRTPLRLLSTLKQNLIADEPQLNFDYFTFLQSCIDLLCTMEILLQRAKHFTSHSEMVAHLLWQASETTIKGLPHESTDFGRAARLLKIHVEKQGNIFSKAAYDQSSGRIPKHKRPNITQPIEE